ncbi:MAG: CoA-binding protein [Rhodospirillaceae bacterium]|nr:CoA-binding protein [Rhodospirillaceae bacterium]
MEYSDDLIRDILSTSPVVALVGASPRPERASNRVMRFLQSKGHKVFPVNPTCGGDKIHGETVFEAIDEIPGKIDMVDIFRRSEFAGAAVDDAIRVKANTVWMQLDVIDRAAAERAQKAGLRVIMDRCPVIEYRRLGMA